MSDGGGGSDSRRPKNRKIGGGSDDGWKDDVVRRAGGDEYGREVSKIAVAQICESVGYESFQSSALEALSNVAVRYLRDLGKTAAFYANLAGRTESSVVDVVRGLEDLGSPQGFSGASDVVDNCVLGSGTVRDLVEYVDTLAEEIPFAQPLPRFPVIRDRSTVVPSFAQMGETPPGKHIPDWLPAFPDLHTYIHTPLWNERATDPRAEKIEQARQRRKAERSLLSLQKRLLGIDSSSVPSTSNVDLSEDVKDIKTNGNNPFLATPFKAVEKDINPVSLPEKVLKYATTDNHFSVLDTFVPAIEAMKDGICEVSDKVISVLPEKRPAVQLKFVPRKKLIGEALNLSLPDRDSVRQTPWLERGEDKDDRKRRAAFILRQSMENSQELTQLTTSCCACYSKTKIIFNFVFSLVGVHLYCKLLPTIQILFCCFLIIPANSGSFEVTKKILVQQS